MKWSRVQYNSRGHVKYVSGDFTIKRTHDLNMFTGREMSAENQRWEIFKNDEKIEWAFTLREAKAYVATL